MKKSITALLIVSVVLNFAMPVYCGDPLTKLGRGVCNIVTAPMEIPNRIGKVRESSGFYEAYSYGLIQGIVMTGFRMAVGILEVGLFILPVPENYEPVLTDPEYFINIPPKEAKDQERPKKEEPGKEEPKKEERRKAKSKSIEPKKRNPADIAKVGMFGPY